MDVDVKGDSLSMILSLPPHVWHVDDDMCAGFQNGRETFEDFFHLFGVFLEA